MGWIGVDLDGTLATYNGWKGQDHIGPVVEQMKQRVLFWVGRGMEVKIFTARVSETKTRPEVVKTIKKWLIDNGLPDLPVTNIKDYAMVELWDDRCVQVAKNTGRQGNQPQCTGCANGYDLPIGEFCACCARMGEDFGYRDIVQYDG